MAGAMGMEVGPKAEGLAADTPPGGGKATGLATATAPPPTRVALTGLGARTASPAEEERPCALEHLTTNETRTTKATAPATPAVMMKAIDSASQMPLSGEASTRSKEFRLAGLQSILESGNGAADTRSGDGEVEVELLPVSSKKKQLSPNRQYVDPGTPLVEDRLHEKLTPHTPEPPHVTAWTLPVERCVEE